MKTSKIIIKELGKTILKNHPELEFCGDCPYLKIEPAYEGYINYPGEHIEGCYTQEQENKCLLENDRVVEIWKGSPVSLTAEYDWVWLKDGKNPKRHIGCLALANHILNQITKERR